jgi:hypothetical protein
MAFPVSPTEGQTFTENNTVWIYSAVTDQWNRSVINPLNQTTYIGSDGAPGGIGGATQVIFNDNGSLASDAGLVYNKTTDVLTTGSLRATSLGTAAAPGIAFETDPNTGIFSPGADQLAVATNGTGRLFVDASGNVGVKIASPSSQVLGAAASSTVAVQGAAGGSVLVLQNDQGTVSTNARIELNGVSSGGNPRQISYIESLQTATTGAGALVFGTHSGAAVVAATERLRITSAGRVGIGTSAPGYQLEVNSGTTDAAALFNSTAAQGSHVRFGRSGTVDGYFGCATGFLTSGTSAGDIGIRSQGALVLGSGGNNNRLFITSAGLVGIGTSVPAAILSTKPSASSTTAATTFTGDGLFIDCANTTDGSGNYGGAISWSRSGSSTTRAAAIANVQTSGDADIQGLAFLTHSSSTSTSPLIEAMRITGAGNVGIGVTSPSNTLEISKESNHGITLARPAGGVNPGNVKLEVSSFGAGTLTADNNLSLTTGSSQQLIVNRGATESFRVDASSRLLVGTSTAHNVGGTLGNAQFSGAGTQVHFVSTSTSPSYVNLAVGSNGADVTAPSVLGRLRFYGYHTNGYDLGAQIEAAVDGTPSDGDLPTRLVFSTTSDSASSPTERLHIKANGSLRYTGNGSISATTGYTSAGVAMEAGGVLLVTRSSYPPMWVNRLTNDGTLVDFAQNSVVEGTISVSGTTVSYNGAHLSRWSQLPNGAERNNILRGSILSNIDEMCEWIDPPTETVLWAEGDELPEGVSVGDVKEQAKSGGPQANEQLNRMKVSDVEGDKNVSGVFQCWDDDDDTYTNDFYCAMTGDFIIRIAEGVTVERGDLLMSAGDGTAKPQDDDIIRSKTIAKVTSINVSCTYEDGSYCVPCVLMAC